eukprot:1981054-Rhodomonas_salina.1
MKLPLERTIESFGLDRGRDSGWNSVAQDDSDNGHVMSSDPGVLLPVRTTSTNVTTSSFQVLPQYPDANLHFCVNHRLGLGQGQPEYYYYYYYY